MFKSRYEKNFSCFLFATELFSPRVWRLLYFLDDWPRSQKYPHQRKCFFWCFFAFFFFTFELSFFQHIIYCSPLPLSMA